MHVKPDIQFIILSSKENTINHIYGIMHCIQEMGFQEDDLVRLSISFWITLLIICSRARVIIIILNTFVP